MLAGWRGRAQELRGDVIALTWRAAAPACGGTPRRSLRSSLPMPAVRSISSLTFIPVLGYLDGLVLLPIGVLLAVKMIPRSYTVVTAWTSGSRPGALRRRSRSTAPAWRRNPFHFLLSLPRNVLEPRIGPGLQSVALRLPGGARR
jgi:hypothetical protein